MLFKESYWIIAEAENSWLEKVVEHTTPTGQKNRVKVKSLPPEEREKYNPNKKPTKDSLKNKIEEKKKELSKVSPKKDDLKNEIENKKKQLETKNKPFFDEKEISLPTEVSQPEVKNADDFYKQAEEAQNHMMTWLDRGEGLEKDINAKHYEVKSGSDFERAISELDNKGPIIITAPLKGIKRAQEKVDADYNGDWSKLTDGVRATVAVDKFDQLHDVVKKLKESGMQLAKVPKDRFKEPTSAGYRDILLNVKYPNGHVGELQLHIKSMLKAKEEGHKLYEGQRSIPAKAKAEGRKDMNEDELKVFKKLDSDMKTLYNNAWKKGN